VDETARTALAGALETAVLVPMPGLAAAVDRHRRQFDLTASWGAPPHVTVLYPFVPPREVDDALLAGLTDLLGSVPGFDCSFTATGWFGEEVLFLAPEPDEPFRRLTATVAGAFPDHPPYRGAHGNPTPHLGIGQRRLGDLAGLHAAEQALRPELPLPVQVRTAALWAGSREPGSWRPVADLPLARPTA